MTQDKGGGARSHGAAAGPRNAMTVDVEDYFQVQAFENLVPRRDWDRLPSRVADSTNRVLDLFARHDVKGTFFTLGWVAERHPALIRRIVAEGHELASHGYGHQRADRQSPGEFREDVRQAKRILEDAGGVGVAGYRAPSFSIGDRNAWAFEVLAEEGYRYSSSVYPIRHDIYGSPDAPRFAHHPRGRDGVVEYPLTTVRIAGRNLPCAGGGYFRLLPPGFSTWAIRRVNMADGRPGIFYFHPWEIDPGQPRFAKARFRSRFRHYTNLGRMEERLDRILGQFAWGRMDDVLAHDITRPMAA